MSNNEIETSQEKIQRYTEFIVRNTNKLSFQDMTDGLMEISDFPSRQDCQVFIIDIRDQLLEFLAFEGKKYD